MARLAAQLQRADAAAAKCAGSCDFIRMMQSSNAACAWTTANAPKQAQWTVHIRFDGFNDTSAPVQRTYSCQLAELKKFLLSGVQ